MAKLLTFLIIQLAKDHSKNSIKVRPLLVRHLLCDRLLIKLYVISMGYLARIRRLFNVMFLVSRLTYRLVRDVIQSD